MLINNMTWIDANILQLKKSARAWDATKRQSATVHMWWNWCNRPNSHMKWKKLVQTMRPDLNMLIKSCNDYVTFEWTLWKLRTVWIVMDMPLSISKVKASIQKESNSRCRHSIVWITKNNTKYQCHMFLAKHLQQKVKYRKNLNHQHSTRFLT